MKGTLFNIWDFLINNNVYTIFSYDQILSRVSNNPLDLRDVTVDVSDLQSHMAPLTVLFNCSAADESTIQPLHLFIASS